MENKHAHGLVKVPGAAEILGLSKHTIRRYVLERKIPFIKLGNAVRFDPNELAQYINERRVAAAK